MAVRPGQDTYDRGVAEVARLTLAARRRREQEEAEAAEQTRVARVREATLRRLRLARRGT